MSIRLQTWAPYSIQIALNGLEVTGKYQELLHAISDPMFDVDGITNKGLQQKLGYLSWAKGMTGKQLFSRVSRHLRLLRDHGLIRKQPKQRKYLLTDKGRQLTTALNALIGASTEQLFKMSA